MFSILPAKIQSALSPRAAGYLGPTSELFRMSKKKSRSKPVGTAARILGGIPDSQDINRLVGMFNEGRFEEAEMIAEAMTVNFPHFGFAWKVMGVLLSQMGRTAEALAPMRKSALLSHGDPEAHFNLGNLFKELGQLPDAVSSFRRALALDANYVEAHSNLGTVLQALGRFQEAVSSFRRVLVLLPKSAAAHFNLGNVLGDLGQFEDAIASYRNALEIAPDYVDAYVSVGAALQSLGQINEAVESYTQAIAVSPGYAEAHCKLGDALRQLGSNELAESSYRKAIELRPAYPEAHNGLGVVLQDLGRLNDALDCYQQAVALAPDLTWAHFNLGTVLKDLGRLEAAIPNLRRAIELNSRFAEAYVNLGHVLNALGRPTEALPCYKNALDINPNFVVAYSNQGVSMHEVGRLDEAVSSFRRALDLDPFYSEAHLNMGAVMRDLGHPMESVACYRRALAIKPAYGEARSNMLFVLAYNALLPAERLLEEAKQWQHNVIPESTLEAARMRRFNQPARDGRRLRIGYVSGDFRQHSVSYFIEPLFRFHDRKRVEVFAYSTSQADDVVSLRFRELADSWRVVAGLDDETVRRGIEGDAVDVLVDLSGHTAHNRLGVFAARAAPIQAHYLGYFASTGLDQMDYWIGDSVILPATEDEHYSEKIWRLPRVWISYPMRDELPPSKWSPADNDQFWLGTFNTIYKLTPETIALWARILHQLPEAKLLLKNHALGSPATRTRIADEFAAHGIGVERLELLAKTDDWASHMALYDRLDIALDPIGGTGGGTTTADALWMGVPVVTLAGDAMTQRMSASMLNSIGQAEWIAKSEAEYIAKVVALAHDIKGRRNLRFTQRDRMRHSPLCDAPGLARALEDAYESMFDSWWQKNESGTTGGNPTEMNGNQPC